MSVRDDQLEEHDETDCMLDTRAADSSSPRPKKVGRQHMDFKQEDCNGSSSAIAPVSSILGHVRLFLHRCDDHVGNPFFVRLAIIIASVLCMAAVAAALTTIKHDGPGSGLGRGGRGRHNRTRLSNCSGSEKPWSCSRPLALDLGDIKDTSWLFNHKRPYQLPKQVPYAKCKSEYKKMKCRKTECQGCQAPLLVIGCGNSGTHSFAEMVSKVGLEAKHERFAAHVTVGWFYAARFDSNHWASPNPLIPAHTKFKPIFKIHRNPISHIRSMVTGFNGFGGCEEEKHYKFDIFSWHYASAYIPLPVPEACRINSEKDIVFSSAGCCGGETERINMAVHYWTQWNLLSDKYADRSFQIEQVNVKDVMKAWRAICPGVDCAVFNVRKKNMTQFIQPKPREGHGTDKVHKVQITWSRLREVSGAIVEVMAALAASYGYPTTD